MSYKKLIILILIFSLISLIMWLFIPVKKVLAFGINFDNKLFINKKMYRVDTKMIKNILMKDEDIENVKILRTPFGIILLFAKKKEIVAYYNDNGLLKGIDNNGNIFKTKNNKKNLTIITGNKEILIEGLYLMRVNKSADTIFLTEDCPMTYEGNIKILWGKEDYRKKLEIVKIIKKNLKEKGVIDMRFKNNIFLRRR